MFDAAVVAAPLREELARLRADGRRRSVPELVALAEQCQSFTNQVAALQVLAMAHLAAIEDVELEDGTVVEQHRGLGHQRLDAPALVSDQLGLSDAAATSRMTVAVEVVTRAPFLLEAMASGRLDAYRAGIVCEELREASPEVCREVGARLEGSLGTEPPAMLRRRVRRVLGAVDADLVRAKAARARAARSLRRWPGDEPGVDTWMGSFPVEQARSGWAVIDGLARQYVRDGRASGVDEARADALMDLIHSRATGTFVVQLAVPADRLASEAPSTPADSGFADAAERASGAVARLAGRASGSVAEPAGLASSSLAWPAEDDALVTVAGLGMPGNTHVRREWLEHVVATEPADRPDSTSSSDPTDGSGATQRTRRGVVACQADTGALLAVDRATACGRPGTTESAAYRPPPTLVELVKARDGRCRFPGCTVSAVFCDLDHVRPWPSGPTEAGNLICLCRRHHRIKQTVRWRVRIEPDATVTWTDPAGRTRATLPIDFLQLERDAPHDAEPMRDGHGRDKHAHDGHGHGHDKHAHDKHARDEHAHDKDRLGAPVHGSRSPELSAAETRRGGSPPADSPPVDEVGAHWSAWEDELAHHLAGAERDRRRTGRPRFRVSRHLLHRCREHHRRGDRSSSARAGPEEPPPF
ncbi:HNH endonuclease signature motif containing protein [Phycicoccus sp. Soil802]|uniref:HNH endonuclease signature motif containing protein n=1 Tax=Phycicoccus sp. Soil802 TaxID=1736414 RepID=UPI0007031F3D|nr:HNH endonuclease signature motif containing protein [Phycicoccus sp. Soil802]KRF22792.1 hypothetical protein ASG91_15475 [Phycicoccus sp. Soil802]